MKKIILLLAAIAAFSSAMMGAEYKVEIDCNHRSVQNTDTGNRITVSFKDFNEKRIQAKYMNGVRNCLVKEAVYSFSFDAPPAFLEFMTNGNDAFYIDEFRLYRNGVLVKHEGRDNGRGWCLSTDPGDANGAWRRYVSGGCQTKISFRLGNAPAKPPQRNYQQECYNRIQGRIPWNRQGNTRWAPENVRRLCQGTRNPNALIACFSAWINANTTYTRATQICRANYNSRPQRPQPAQPRNYEQECYNRIQGRIPWNRQGNTRWAPENVRKLCQGTRNPNALIACFSAWINANTIYTRATQICRANYNSRPQRPRPSRPPQEDQEPFIPKPPPPGTGITNLGPISWSQTLPRRFRGRNQRIKIRCPANGTLLRITGTFVYTDSSSICTAAMHTGVITKARGGSVTIIPRPGRSSYRGTRRNGMSSLSSGRFDGSFEILGN
jgi:hypothetical protein